MPHGPNPDKRARCLQAKLEVTAQPLAAAAAFWQGRILRHRVGLALLSGFLLACTPPSWRRQCYALLRGIAARAMRVAIVSALFAKGALEPLPPPR
jgi:hypothetical protein